MQEMAYDPWGQRRTVSSPTPLSLSTLQSSYFKVAKPVTQRGFTGHEMIDEVGIIHMNGRIYDAKLGRFMQADPIIQDPTSIASLNRYSYCANNPLNATDPSGFSFLSKAWKQLRPFIGVIVAIVMTCVMPAAVGFWAQLAQASLIGAVSGAVGAAANGGNILKGAFYGAFSAAAGVVGGPLGGALAAGAIADREGGSFGRAFLAAAIGGNGGVQGFSVGGLVRSSVLGGVASKITGGKFKNGAASAAFMYAVSAGVNRMAKGGEDITSEDRKNVQASYCAYGDSETCGDMIRVSGVGESNEKTGFKYAVFKDETGPYRVAFAGTDDVPDIVTDLKQALGFRDDQYDRAVEVAREMRKRFGNDIIFTGHSLGGGLATAAAYVTGLPATTFNSAGLSWRYGGFSGKFGNVRAFYNSTDMLNGVQDLTTGIIAPAAVGNRIMLGSRGASGLHFISGVCGAMGMGANCGVQ